MKGVVMAWMAMLGLLLGAGSVTLRDGRAIEGEVRLEAGAVVVQPAGGETQRIAWDHVMRIGLRAEPPIIRPAGSADGALPAGWTSSDIGPVRQRGSATCAPEGLLRIKACGWGAWGPEDAFHFVWVPWSGDGQIMARIAGVDTTFGQVVAGVMIRESLAADAPMAGACLHPAGQVRLNRRPAGDAPEFRRPEDAEPRTWVRLTRRGDQFESYRSIDGRIWERTDSFRVPMKRDVLIGLAAWTLSNVALGEARIDSVTIIPGTPAATWFADGDGLREGVILRNGNVLAGPILSAGEGSVRILHREEERQVPLGDVARLVFNPAPPQAATRGRRGVWLANGDFIEGQVMEVVNRPVEGQRKPQPHVGVRSLLFGMRHFEAGREVTAAVLADTTPAPTAWELRTADGSLHRVNALTIEVGVVQADGAPVADVVEIRRAP